MFSSSDIFTAIDIATDNEKKDVTFKGVSIDTRSINDGDLFVCIKGKHFDGHHFVEVAVKKGALGVVTEKKIKAPKEVKIFKVKDTLKALGNIANFHRCRFDIPVIAITGSNGKTTTKELVASVLSRKFKTLKNVGNLNNLIGVPLTLLNLNKEHNVCVVEMGMNQRGEIKRLFEIANPAVGLVTNIGDAHIGNFSGLMDIKEEKITLLKMLGKEGFAVVNCDDPLILDERKKIRCKSVEYSIKSDAHIGAKNITHDDSGKYKFDLTFKESDQVAVSLPMPGYHNIYNAMAAAAVGTIFNIDKKDIKKGIEECREVSMRMQLISGDGFTAINDAYNANPSSVRSALKTLSSIESAKKKVFIFGDMFELGDNSVDAHILVGKDVYKSGIDILITVGKNAESAAQSAIQSGMNIESVSSFNSVDEAFITVKSFAKESNCLLFKASRGMQLEKLLDNLFKGEK